jgi:type II secretory pathway pseudopilin PulG
MRCRSKQILSCPPKPRRRRMSAPAFSLVEAVTALIILALISSSVLVVINRCMASAVDSTLRMQAFEVARDNMETLLSKGSVKEMIEYGSSDKYPGIRWQTTVETFYEPVSERMWARAVCSAEYADTAGDVQTIELTHWLTGLTREQLIQMIEAKQREAEEQEMEQGTGNPSVLPDDYPDWSMDKIIQWLKDNGYL